MQKSVCAHRLEKSLDNKLNFFGNRDINVFCHVFLVTFCVKQGAAESEVHLSLHPDDSLKEKDKQAVAPV